MDVRFTASLSRAEVLNLIASLSATVANPHRTDDWFPLCVEFSENGDQEAAYFGIDNYGTDRLAYAACYTPDLAAEAQAAEDARAARIESSYLNGR